MHNFLYSLPRHFWPCSAAEYQKLNLFPLTNTMPSVIPCPSPPPPPAVHAQTCFYTQSLQVPLATKINLCEIQGKKKSQLGWKIYWHAPKWIHAKKIFIPSLISSAWKWLSQGCWRKPWDRGSKWLQWDFSAFLPHSYISHTVYDQVCGFVIHVFSPSTDMMEMALPSIDRQTFQHSWTIHIEYLLYALRMLFNP